MKRLFWHIWYYLGLPALTRAMSRGALTIVLYHGVDESRDLGSYNYRKKFITPEAFSQHLAYYREHHTVLSLDEAITALADGALPPNPLVITFDDGYRNNYTHAFPLLKRYGMPATIFVTTNFITHEEPLWVDRLEYAINAGTCCDTLEEKIAFDTAERARLKRLPHLDRMSALEALEERCGARLTGFAGDRSVYAPLTLADMEEMGEYGIMFGAHTQSHPILTSFSTDAQREEISGSQEALLHLTNAHSRVFAYPNGQPGDMDDVTAQLVRNLGFIAALTTIPGVNGVQTDRYMLRRFTLDGTDTFPLFVVTVSGVRHIITSFIQHAKGS